MKAILVFVVVLGMASIGWGQSYYKYVDKNGTVCFTEDPNSEDVRGVVEKEGMKVLKAKEIGRVTAEDLRNTELSKIRQAEEKRRRQADAYEQGKLDYQKAVEERIRAEQRRIQLEQERQAQAIAEAQRQAEEYRKKTYGLTPPPPTDPKVRYLYPTPGGAVDQTGNFYPNSGPKAYIDLQTGRIIPKW